MNGTPFPFPFPCGAEIHIAQALQDGFLALDPNHLRSWSAEALDKTTGFGRPQTMRLS